MQKRRFNSKREVSKYADCVAPMTTKYKDGMSTRELKLAVANHGKNHRLTAWMYLLDLHNSVPV